MNRDIRDTLLPRSPRGKYMFAIDEPIEEKYYVT